MDCPDNIDTLKLVREGSDQGQRRSEALQPGFVSVNEHTTAHQMVFARAYAAELNFFDDANKVNGNWQRFFGDDVSVLLAAASIEDVGIYAGRIQELFRFLKDINNKTDDALIKDCLGTLFAMAGSMALQLVRLKEALPPGIGLKTTLTNIIQRQLKDGFDRLGSYYKAGTAEALLTTPPLLPEVLILGEPVVPFEPDCTSKIYPDWSMGPLADPSVYGDVNGTEFERANHIATHNLFTSVFDELLKAYSRTVAEAKKELNETLSNTKNHQPHYALFLAFLQLKEYARTEANKFTGRHLDFYYRDVLKLKEKPAAPGQAHVLVELAKHAGPHLFEANTLLKAGKDDQGKGVAFGTGRDFVANKASVASLKTIYRHKNTGSDTLPQMNDRLFASPVSNSEDGAGTLFFTEDNSWHPFFNKSYSDGALGEIKMPGANVGFAIGSHHLYLAEGNRVITLSISIEGTKTGEFKDQVTCLFTGAKTWFEKAPSSVNVAKDKITLGVTLEGNDPAIVPYNAKLHGYHFDASLPMLIVRLRQDTSQYAYETFQDIKVTSIDLTVGVTGLKNLAVSNDYGPVDTSKPFLPFGAVPVKGSGFVIGSKELFQKNLKDPITLNVAWQEQGARYGANRDTSFAISYLNNGIWGELSDKLTSLGEKAELKSPNNTVNDEPDFSPIENYSNNAARGFTRISLQDTYGLKDFQDALRNFLLKVTNVPPVSAPVIPVAIGLSINYASTQIIDLSNRDEIAFTTRKPRFFHIAPFGEAEMHACLVPDDQKQLYLFPQFNVDASGIKRESLGEFYIGVKDLQPPQSLSLLFQVLDGTADPLAKKPDPGTHIHWSYLQKNVWLPFEKNQVEDLTGELTRSATVTVSMPRHATSDNSLMPAGMFWIRLLVHEKPEAVCKILLVGAQAVLTRFVDQGNDPAYPEKLLPSGTIAKLLVPDAEVKKVTQPFDGFGGRGIERKDDFYKRISERLRHKARSIALWDFERMILEAFPRIYKVKCLNHTEYESTEDGAGTYRELAPGHVTIITIPDQEHQNVRNPLRPYTSLGTLLEIEAFLRNTASCFAKLHVRNPLFEEVKTDFKVHFLPGTDDLRFYEKKLQEEITRFLSPWAFSKGVKPTFGGKVYKSTLVNFVEERSYVDYVTDFKLLHKPGGSSTFSDDLNEVEPSKAVSILVSVPPSQHGVTSILALDVDAIHETCACES